MPERCFTARGKRVCFDVSAEYAQARGLAGSEPRYRHYWVLSRGDVLYVLKPPRPPRPYLTEDVEVVSHGGTSNHALTRSTDGHTERFSTHSGFDRGPKLYARIKRLLTSPGPGVGDVDLRKRIYPWTTPGLHGTSEEHTSAMAEHAELAARLAQKAIQQAEEGSCAGAFESITEARERLGAFTREYGWSGRTNAEEAARRDQLLTMGLTPDEAERVAGRSFPTPERLGRAVVQATDIVRQRCVLERRLRTSSTAAPRTPREPGQRPVPVCSPKPGTRCALYLDLYMKGHGPSEIAKLVSESTGQQVKPSTVWASLFRAG